jgi:hypothetical protein
MFNATQQLRVADNLAQLWVGLMADYEAPSRAQFLEWAGMAPEETAVYVLNRAARKDRRERQKGLPMDSERLGRYVTGTLRNEREGRHTFTVPAIVSVK